MANSYFELTGVLKIAQATPILHALYDGYELDDEDPGNGLAYIAIMEGTDRSWDTIIESLTEVAVKLGFDEDFGDGTPEEVLNFLAVKFSVVDMPRFNDFLAATDFSEESELEPLYYLATIFNDGHGIEWFKTEAAWTCSKPRLFEFGGCGYFEGKHCVLSSSSSHAPDLGETLETALGQGNLDAAATRIRQEVQRLLDGVIDEVQRNALRDIVLK